MPVLSEPAAQPETQPDRRVLRLAHKIHADSGSAVPFRDLPRKARAAHLKNARALIAEQDARAAAAGTAEAPPVTSLEQYVRLDEECIGREGIFGIRSRLIKAGGQPAETVPVTSLADYVREAGDCGVLLPGDAA